MRKVYDLVKDALTICCTSTDEQYWKDLAEYEVGDRVDYLEFYLRRIEGKYFDVVYQICYYDPALDKDVLWGELKYGISKDATDCNHDLRDGSRFIWLSVNNRVLYTGREYPQGPMKGQVYGDDTMFLFHYLDVFNLEFYHISNLDLALDCNFDIARRIKGVLRSKDYTTILNGKRIEDRTEDRPEIVSIYTGSLNRDKYLSLYVKQKKAIHDKNRGLVLTAYNKTGELLASGKEYISEFYGDPKKLYRLEIHFNADEVKGYVAKQGLEMNPQLLFDKEFLFDMYVDALSRLLRFERNGEKVDWGEILLS